MFPFNNAALITAVMLWRWKMEMHFRHVFVMNRVLRLTWPERQFIDVVHSSVCPLGKKTINQIRRQNLVKAEVKRGNRCSFPCWLSKQLIKKCYSYKPEANTYLLGLLSLELQYTSHMNAVLLLHFVSCLSKTYTSIHAWIYTRVWNCTHFRFAHTFQIISIMSSISNSLKSSSLSFLLKQAEVAIYLVSLFNKLQTELKSGCLSSAGK